MNICICLKVDICFHFSYIPRSWIAGSYDKNMFTILHSHQQCVNFQFSISLPRLGIVGLIYFSHSSRHLTVILIFYSRMTNDVEPFYRLIFYSHMFCEHLLPVFQLNSLNFYYLILRDLYSPEKPFIQHIFSKYFFSSSVACLFHFSLVPLELPIKIMFLP